MDPIPSHTKGSYLLSVYGLPLADRLLFPSAGYYVKTFSIFVHRWPLCSGSWLCAGAQFEFSAMLTLPAAIPFTEANFSIFGFLLYSKTWRCFSLAFKLIYIVSECFSCFFFSCNIYCIWSSVEMLFGLCVVNAFLVYVEQKSKVIDSEF